jgi:ABC-type branched-subunit amino acid transport system substrate-binding protein
MGGGTGSEPWEGLDTFDTGPLLAVGYPLDRGSMPDVKKALQAPEFAAAIEAFEASALPPAYSAKQSAKDAAIKAWKDAIEAAKTAKPDELKEKVQAAMNATNSLRSK